MTRTSLRPRRPRAQDRHRMRARSPRRGGSGRRRRARRAGRRARRLDRGTGRTTPRCIRRGGARACGPPSPRRCRRSRPRSMSSTRIDHRLTRVAAECHLARAARRSTWRSRSTIRGVSARPGTCAARPIITARYGAGVVDDNDSTGDAVDEQRPRARRASCRGRTRRAAARARCRRSALDTQNDDPSTIVTAPAPAALRRACPCSNPS